jgi:uncharacterized membrane protein YdjX (TVP38/TMEM64 family)
MYGRIRLILKWINHPREGCNCGIDSVKEGSSMNTPLLKKLAIAVIILGVFVAFWAFDLGRYLTLSYLKGSMDNYRTLYAHHRALVILVYFFIYVIATSLSLPGAVILTISGGALFGLFTGTLIVSFASTIGATLACFAARFLMRDWVQGKFGEKIVKINEGVEKEGAFYLFTLRLIPVFPFWIINLVMGLTKMSLWRFYWVSQLGMLAGTMVYVNAGKELAKIDSVKGILSPGLLISFVLLGVFPMAVKKLLALYRRERKHTINQSPKGEKHGTARL